MKDCPMEKDGAQEKCGWDRPRLGNTGSLQPLMSVEGIDRNQERKQHAVT